MANRSRQEVSQLASHSQNGLGVDTAGDCCRCLPIGGDARSAISSLKDCLNDNDPDMREAAAIALWKVSGSAKDTLPTLGKFIDGENPKYRDQALAALAKMGPDARPVEPTLRKLMGGNDLALQVAAAEVLWKSTGATKESLAVLIRAMRNGKDGYASSVRILGEMGAVAKPAVALIRKRLESEADGAVILVLRA